MTGFIFAQEAVSTAENVENAVEKTVEQAGATLETSPGVPFAQSGGVSGFLQPAQDFFTTLGTWLSEQKINLLYFVIGIAAAFILAYIVSWVIRKVFLALARKTRTGLDDDIINGLHAPIVWLVVATGVMGSISLLSIDAKIMAFISKVYYASATLILVWAVLRIVKCFNEYFKGLADRTGNTFDNLLVDLLRRTVKVTVWVIAILFIAQNIFQLNVSAMLAGAGVVGLAVAFAA